MNNAFEQTRFTIEFTEDGSPTLRLPSEGESMHHSGGAATETEYIYKSVIGSALNRYPEAKLAVVGLGLGYIEISWAIEAIKLNLQKKSEFVSFETEFELKNIFLKWIESDSEKIYDSVCKSLDEKIKITEIKEAIKYSLEKNKLRGDLCSEYDQNKSYNILCFDAFSSKTSGSLWTEEFLNDFIKKSCHETCVFTTYACTGVLKRVLRANGFTLLERVGFKGKRDSTLAVRGGFNSSGIFRTS
jgi:hypothetical protein